jgi:nitroreductase
LLFREEKAVDALENILSRRSIRRYTDVPVQPEIVNRLLMAAMASPSASNSQPWQFIIITDRKILDEIPQFHPNAYMLPGAPLSILVCAEPDKSDYWQQECGAATQNILLAVHALGLGAVWLGIYPREERVAGMRKICQLPNNIVPMALIALGYPVEPKSPSERYNDEKVHHNVW